MDKTLHERLTGWRRHLHANSKLTRDEARTAAFVRERLSELGIPCVGGIGGHGVMGRITHGASNRSVGPRADMDALPIQETTGAAYASRNPGVMHACGHDGHTVSLLGVAALLAADTSWSGTVPACVPAGRGRQRWCPEHDRGWPPVRSLPDGTRLQLP